MATLTERLKKVHHGSGSALGRTVRTVFMTILDGLLGDTEDDSDTAGAADRCCASASSRDPWRDLLSFDGVLCIFKGTSKRIAGTLSYDYNGTMTDMAAGTASSSGDSVVCETPSHAFDNITTVVSVELTLNGKRHERTDSGLVFTYYREDELHVLPKLTKVQPYGGPTAGGTLVNISAVLVRKLTELSPPVCRFGNGFGDSIVPATILPQIGTGDHATVLCASPPSEVGELSQRDVPLNVAMNGQDYVRRAIRFTYYVLDSLVISSLHPRGGPTAGGTPVIVTGRHLGMSLGGISCQFGDKDNQDVWVPGVAINGSAVSCTSPPLPLSGDDIDKTYPATHSVRVTVNGDRAVPSISSQPFSYFVANRALAITAIHPSSGPIEGGTLVTISGTGFRSLGGIECVFTVD